MPYGYIGAGEPRTLIQTATAAMWRAVGSCISEGTA